MYTPIYFKIVFLIFPPSFSNQTGTYILLVTGSLRERLSTLLYPGGTNDAIKAQFLDAPQKDYLFVVRQNGHWQSPLY